MFSFLRRKKERGKAAERLYEAVVKQSRHPVFYKMYAVPDTETGRFDLICLHAFLVMDRLHEEGRQGKNLAQALFDRMFRDMDRNLREMGVGDLALPKHIKRMMKGFNGRAVSYREAMASGEASPLIKVLERNLYGAVAANAKEGKAKTMVLYMNDNAAYLKELSWESLVQGSFSFRNNKLQNCELQNNENDRKHDAGMVA